MEIPSGGEPTGRALFHYKCIICIPVYRFIFITDYAPINLCQRHKLIQLFSMEFADSVSSVSNEVKWVFFLQFTLQIYVYISIQRWAFHYTNVIIGSIASQITSLTIVYSNDYPGSDQRKHQSSASLAFVRGMHRRPVNSPHKGSVTRKMFPFDDVIMSYEIMCGPTLSSFDYPVHPVRGPLTLD